MSLPLPQRESTLECDTVPSVKAKAIKPSEPDTSPIQVRRSTRSTKGKPPLRYGSIVSHSVKAHSKFGKWLSTISKKVDSTYDHMFDWHMNSLFSSFIIVHIHYFIMWNETLIKI